MTPADDVAPEPGPGPEADDLVAQLGALGSDDQLLDDLDALLDHLRAAAGPPADLDVDAIWRQVQERLDDDPRV